MKKLALTCIAILLCYCGKSQAQTSDVFTTSVTFPANFQIGDYIEFGQATPIAANASGYYEISIAYTRGNVAAAATHIASATHNAPNVWRETGRINNNIYTTAPGTTKFNFTIDVNPGNHRFRIRAINNLGTTTHTLPVSIKVRSINFTTAFTVANVAGNTTADIDYLSMTNDWDLIVGDIRSTSKATHAIKVISNGNVGIGTTQPTEKLTVNGTLRAKEVKVEASPWPDYVFEESYPLLPLEQVEAHLKQHKHLPNIPTAETVQENGIALGEMNRKLLEKIEELTLYLIDHKKEIDQLKQEVQALKKP